eukprot:17158_1
MNGPEWCTIESDPGVFTELISKFGVKGVQVEELWGLENADFERLSPMYGLIFLFKWDQSLQSDISSNVLDQVPEGVFFAKQTIHNACATQSILSILLNCPKKIELGPTLTNFLDFTGSLDPESIGMALANQDDIRIAHNSFSRAEPIQIERAKDDEEGEAFHFISYVPINGILYEIDGLQRGPRLIDGCDETNWFEKARNVLQQRMASYQSKELRFTLLAICGDLKEKYEEEKKTCTDEARLNELEQLITNEQNKREKWTNENIRRRHNYFPFILNLIGILGKQKVLRDLTERAKEKKKEKLKRMEDEKKKREEAEKKDKEKEKEKEDTDKDTEMTDKTQ